MRRGRGRTSRMLGVVLMCTLGAGIFMGVRKFTATGTGDRVQGTGSIDDAASASRGVISDDQDKSAIVIIEKPAEPLLLVDSPATRPAEVALNTPVAPVVNEPVIVLGADPLGEGRSAFEAGDPLKARRIISEAIRTGRFNDTEMSEARSLIGKISEILVFGGKVLKDDPFVTQYTVKPGDRMTSIAAANGVTWELLCRINGISDPRKLRAGQTLKIVKGPFHAIVSKKPFTMDIYLGVPGDRDAVLAGSFPVGLGKDDSTPVGAWLVEPHKKLTNPTYFSPRGEGTIAADDPMNPLGERWIGLRGVEGQAVGKESYGIHGTIEPETIGKQASMGCIRLRNEDVTVVFDLLVEGKSTVIVKE